MKRLKSQSLPILNLVAIDIGTINTAVALFRDELIHFEIFSIQNLNEFVAQVARLDPMFKSVSHVVIEHQMSLNIRAKQIENWLHLWLKLQHPECVIVKFMPNSKYKQCDKQLYNTQNKRKKWTSKFVIENLVPTSLVEKFNALTKKDDVADAILMGHIVQNQKTK